MVFYFILLLLSSFRIQAAENISIHNIPIDELKKIVTIKLSEKQKEQTLTAINTLIKTQQHTDIKQIKHTRLQQEYLGIPIFGAQAIFHNKNNQLLRMNGTIYTNLEKDLGKIPPYNQHLADNIMQTFILPWQDKNIQEQQISPIIFIDNNSKAHFAYKVTAIINYPDSIPEKPMAIIDAQSKDILVSWNDIKTSRSIVNGVGFGGNQKIGIYKFGRDTEYLNISRDDFLGICYMENSNVKVVDMNFGYQNPNIPMAFTCPYSKIDNAYWTGYDENGYDLVNGGYSSSNDAIYIGDIVKNMYKKIYKVEVLTNNNRPTQLIMRVHYGRNFANAFWDGKQMTFGDGDALTHPFVSLSIAAHEISHGFTEQNSNLAYYGQSGGMNESFSDMAAQAAEYYVYKKNSWLIGHDIMKKISIIDALRYMDTPSKDHLSIDYAHQFREGMDVHYSSGVYNKLFYLLANAPKWNPSKAFRVMLKANMDYWTQKSTFADGACGIIYAAEDLNYSTTDIKNILNEVMIDYSQC